jgi:putative transposase
MVDRRGPTDGAVDLCGRPPRPGPSTRPRDYSAVRYYRTPPRLEYVDYTKNRSYMVTFCVADRSRVFSDSRLAAIAVDRIKHYRNAGWYWLYAYCVMPDHIHIVLRTCTGKRHLSRIVAVIRSAILCEARRMSGSFRWQRGYHERIVRDGDDSADLVTYVLRNPYRAGIAAEDQPHRFAGVIDSFS